MSNLVNILSTIWLTGATFVLGQDLLQASQAIERLGIVGLLLLSFYLFYADKIVSGATHRRVIGERDEAWKQQKEMYERYIPLVLDANRIAAEAIKFFKEESESGRELHGQKRS